MDHVVTVFVRHRGEVLLLRRSDEVGTYRGRWAGVSGYVEGDHELTRPDAERELEEEAGIVGAAFLDEGEPLHVVDAENDREWVVHPYLVTVDDREVETDWESRTHEWVDPTAMLDRETVPRLWAAYRRVAPTVERVAADDEHGSAYISARALEVLRDAAAEAAHADALDDPEYTDRSEVREAARRLRDARPSMSAPSNRVNRVMATAADLGGIAARAHEVLQEALDADEAAAERAADLLDGKEAPTVVTLSRSGTVRMALRAAEPAVTVAESRPAREGVDVAEELAEAGLDVTLTTDANLAMIVAGGGKSTPDAALVGADAVLADGDVVNKVGTRALGLACAREDVPMYVVAARDKVSPGDEFEGASGDPADLYDGGGDVAVENPVFDRTPADCVTAVVTEDGLLDRDGIRDLAETHREYATWDGDGE